MSLALTSRLAVLRDRAAMLAAARTFFKERGLVEVDVPVLSMRASIDPHIDLIEAACLEKKAFLHSSPEYGMKRLLAEGIGDIYQISHVFRKDERGELHNPEFTMVEWYRCALSFEEMIEETLAFISLFLPSSCSFQRIGYREAFLRYVGHYPESLEERDRLFAFEIEPELHAAVIFAFPPEQAALSRVEKGVARRFEVYYKGVELANGYHELADAEEQRRRFERNNRQRLLLGKETYPIDTLFLEALDEGMPDCCGVAVGFDRLMMVRHERRSIDEVIPFGWERS
ncbi:MAG: hypothetical protein JJU12_00705 [Chlamydiales bacterium]|nr:hypothetical protein [Chlamydiales bacterium]